MSGFVAVLKTDGSEVDQSLLRSLTAELAYRGPDARGIWTEGCIGLGHAMLKTTRSCEKDSQPRVAPVHRRAVVADARIDDRRTLCEQLKASGLHAAPDMPDSELILLACQAWGEQAPARLLGDWSFAYWDGERRELMLARDPFGMRCLYLAEFPGGWVISNEIRPLLLYPGVSRQYCQQAMGDFLVFGDISVYDREQTAFAAVRKIPFGGVLVLGAAGARRSSISWQPSPPAAMLHYRDQRDYVAHFAEVMREAVRDRIQAPKVLSLLSGGLDSTTATAYAAELTHAGEGPDSLRALTSIGRDNDPEGVLAAEVAKTLNIPHQILDTRHTRRQPLQHWYSTPHPGNSIFPNTYAERVTCSLARVHLNGYSADHVFCPEPGTLIGVHRQVGLRLAAQCLATLVWRFGHWPPLGLRSAMSGRPTTVPRWALLRFNVPNWLDPDVVDTLSLRERCQALAAMRPDLGQGLRPLGIHHMRKFWSWSMLEERWPTDFAPAKAPDPFLDRRVLEFLWALPPLPWFYKKHLLREAMRKRLPRQVVERRKTSAGARIPDSANLDMASGPWDYGSEVAAMLRKGSVIRRSLHDPIEGWFPLLLDLWAKQTPQAIVSGHKEVAVLG